MIFKEVNLMDPLVLSRLQFAITTVYHFFLVPLTLGLSILVAIFETRYVRTGNEIYKRLTKFWGKIFLINFAAGVVTGIVQEFHFGLNWSEYARFMGDIFGAPLAIEALLAFYLESTFIGLWIFGWDRVSKKVHLAAAWLVAIGSNISALWILIANSFMQNPVGYAIDENGRAVMKDFLAIITNPNLPFQYFHVLSAGVATAGFLVLAFSAWHLLKNRKGDMEFFQRSYNWAVVFALVGALMVGVIGDAHGKFLGKHQPMKIAAAEAIWETEDPADFVFIAGINEKNQENGFSIEVPNALSFLLYNKFTGEVKGLLDLQAEAESQNMDQYGPANYIPPVTISFWSFRIMVGSGMLMVLLGLLALVRSKVKFLQKPWLLKVLIPAAILPYLGSTFGWILTESARQPWIVYGLQKVEDAVSPNITGGTVLFSLILFTLLLGAVVGVTFWLMIKFGTSDPKIEKTAE
jgi:cytochrome d ubiquinol oxidase subunit I